MSGLLMSIRAKHMELLAFLGLVRDDMYVVGVGIWVIMPIIPSYAMESLSPPIALWSPSSWLWWMGKIFWSTVMSYSQAIKLMASKMPEMLTWGCPHWRAYVVGRQMDMGRLEPMMSKVSGTGAYQLVLDLQTTATHFFALLSHSILISLSLQLTGDLGWSFGPAMSFHQRCHAVAY